MRLIKYDETQEDKQLVKDFMEDNGIHSKWLYYFGTYFDVIGLVNSVNSNYYDMNSIYQLAAENGFIGSIEKILALRNSLVRLMKTDLVKDLRKVDNRVEKSEFILKVFNDVMDKSAPELRWTEDGNAGDNEEDQKEGDGDNSDGEGTGIPEEGEEGSQGDQSWNTGLAGLSKITQTLEDMASIVEISYSSPDPSQKPEDELSSNGVSNSGIPNNSPLRLGARNAQLLVQMRKMDSLLKLVSSYKHILDGKASKQEVPSPIGEMRFRKMTSYNELKYIRKQDWMLPDDVIDAKLAKKDFVLERPVHKNKNFNLYVLADVSYSMQGLRMLFQLSLLMALGLHAKETGSKLTVVPFSDVIYGPFKLEDWNTWINIILKLEPLDCTNMNLALSEAYKNIEHDEELLFITDATMDDFPKKDDKIDITAVVLTDDTEGGYVQSFKEQCKSVLINDTKSLEEVEKVGLKLINLL